MLLCNDTTGLGFVRVRAKSKTKKQRPDKTVQIKRRVFLTEHSPIYRKICKRITLWLFVKRPSKIESSLIDTLYYMYDTCLLYLKRHRVSMDTLRNSFS
jgi:hypothetical protein